MAKVKKVQCPRCSEMSAPGKKCEECGLMLDISTVNVDIAQGATGAGADQEPPAAISVSDTGKPKQRKPVKICLECQTPKRIIGRGLCGTCYFRQKKAGVLDKNYPVKNARGRAAVKSKPPSSPSASKPTSPKPNNPATVTSIGSIPMANVRISGLFLPRHDRDENLFKYIKKWADEERRSVADQILFILDKSVYNRINGNRP